MMKHQEFIEKTQDYLTGNLSEADSSAYETHFLNCLTCRDFLLMQQAVLSTVRELIKSGELEKVADVLDLRSILNQIKANRISSPEREAIRSEIDSGTFQKVEKALVKVIRTLESRISLSCRIAPLLDVRGDSQEEGKYMIGDTIFLEFEPPRGMDGYLTVLKYDEDDKVEIVFPKHTADVPFLGKDEDRSVPIIAAKPKGKHYVKAVLTSKQIVEAGIVESREDMFHLIDHLLTSLSGLKDGEWMDAVAKFEVM